MAVSDHHNPNPTFNLFRSVQEIWQPIKLWAPLSSLHSSSLYKFAITRPGFSTWYLTQFFCLTLDPVFSTWHLIQFSTWHLIGFSTWHLTQFFYLILDPVFYLTLDLVFLPDTWLSFFIPDTWLSFSTWYAITETKRSRIGSAENTYNTMLFLEQWQHQICICSKNLRKSRLIRLVAYSFGCWRSLGWSSDASGSPFPERNGKRSMEYAWKLSIETILNNFVMEIKTKNSKSKRWEFCRFF